MQDTKPVIEINKLSKRYGSSQTYALNDLSIKIEAGEVYGFLGPNGAGKSTAIRLIMNFIQPTEGEAQIKSLDSVNDSVLIKKYVGYLPSEGNLYPKMTGKQFLEFMHGLQPAASWAHVNKLAKRLKIDLNKKLGELSKGNRQKVNIIQAFMHQPEVLILDEPTSGLDPLMQEEFYAMIKEAKGRGATVFMSSHILSEVQKTCDRVGFIRAGRLVSEQNIADMETEAAQTFDLTFVGTIPKESLKKVPGLKIVSIDGHDVTIHLHGKLAPLFAELAKHDVAKIDARNLDLEEVFLKYYESKEGK